MNQNPSPGSPAAPQASLYHAPVPSASVNLRIHIDRLTLAGMSRADADLVTSVMRRKLATLARQTPQSKWTEAHLDRLDGGAVPSDIRPEDLGAHLAAQIFRKVSR
jgi:hypothetical protein